MVRPGIALYGYYLPFERAVCGRWFEFSVSSTAVTPILNRSEFSSGISKWAPRRHAVRFRFQSGRASEKWQSFDSLLTTVRFRKASISLRAETQQAAFVQ